MRIIYVILLGMIIFNGVLLIISPMFPSQTTGLNESAYDVQSGLDEDGKDFRNIGSIGDIIGEYLILGGGIFVLGFLATLWTKNAVFIGIGAMVAVVTGVWYGITEPIVSSLLAYSPGYGVNLYNLFLICFALILLFSVIEALSGQQGVEI